ncbi:MAG: helix-turn-helix transcriptional regulator [Synergistaceae bacterium]|nr:helix-turn-helix transcriptional regulator [Synergistaceae bacterium]
MSKYKANNLKALRDTLGISQEKLADNVGVGRDTVRRWEKGTSTPQRRFNKKLTDIFDDNLTLGPPDETSEENTATNKKVEPSITPAESRAAIARSFIVGKCYYIHEKNLVASWDVLQQTALRYERKSGIHHVFRAVKGNWLITYTDAQLVGKNVKEVDENGDCKA